MLPKYIYSAALLRLLLLLLQRVSPARGGEGSVLEYEHDGSIPQLEHTMRATKKGSTVVGVCLGGGRAGAVLVCWDGKHSSPTSSTTASEAASAMLKYPTQSAWRLSRTQAMAATGLGGDARVLVKFARRLLRDNYFAFGSSSSSNNLPNSELSTVRLAAEIASRVHSGTTTAGRRAFAVELLLMGCSTTGNLPCLYQVTPLGHLRRMRAVAIGAGAASANDRLCTLFAPSPDNPSRETKQAESTSMKREDTKYDTSAHNELETIGGDGDNEENEDVEESCSADPIEIALEALLAAKVPMALTASISDEDSAGTDEQEDSQENIHSTLDDMMLAAQGGQLQVLCWEPIAAEEHPRAEGREIGKCHLRIRSATVSSTISALKSIGKRRLWMP